MKDPRKHPHAALLSFTPEFLAADDAELFAICNGCGSAAAKFDLVPDTIYGLSMQPACFQHDWDYHAGRTEQDKKDADFRFLRNMVTLINHAEGWNNVLLRMPRRRRALKYYEAVNKHGGSAFWANKHVHNT